MSAGTGTDGATWEGGLDGSGRRFAIAVARFNEQITRSLLDGARSTLEGAGAGAVDVAWCPGAAELPLVAARLAGTGLYDAVVALGCIVRGGTPHFDYVARIAADGLCEASIRSGVPIAFGVLTCDTMEQALERACHVGSGAPRGRQAAEARKEHGATPRQGGDQAGVSSVAVASAGCNKGAEAAEAALEMASLLALLPRGVR